MDWAYEFNSYFPIIYSTFSSTLMTNVVERLDVVNLHGNQWDCDGCAIQPLHIFLQRQQRQRLGRPAASAADGRLGEGKRAEPEEKVRCASPPALAGRPIEELDEAMEATCSIGSVFTTGRPGSISQV
jgi:hypothetical protein